MKYKELKEQLENFTEDQLNSDIAVALLNSDEVIPVINHVLYWKSKDIEEYNDNDWSNGLDIVDGVLDEDHPYFTIAF